MNEIDTDNFTMRKPCPKCSHVFGRLFEKNGQDTVRCVQCGEFCYNAPRTETGRAQRSVSTVHAAIRPSQRYRIIERGGAKCELCGARGNLHVGHIISVEVGLEFAMTEVDLNDDENLLCICEQCNLGQGCAPMPIRVAVSVLRARMSWRDRELKKS